MNRYDKRVDEAHALAKAGRWREAAEAYAEVVAAGRSDYPIHYNYGTVLLRCGRDEAACEQMRAALRYQPGSLEALNNLSAAYLKLGSPCMAEETSRHIVALEPGHYVGWTNLGLALSNQGRVAEGIEAMRRALDIAPGYPIARDNLLLNLCYIATSGAELAAEHRERCAPLPASPRKAAPGTTTGPTTGRTRVGYVSSDFRSHSVAYFMGGIIGTHDRSAFEVFCYSSTHAPDGITEGFARLTDHFVDISALSDAETAARIEADGIDILVDLGGHTSGNRLGVFALRPAPVQVTYLGYPATTGCAFMDYRMVDALTDPEGSEPFATERLVRLPAPFLCYQPTQTYPPTAPLPALANQHVTFGSFNHSSKISDTTCDLWSRILAAVPDSRLFIKARAFSDASVCERFREKFIDRGIDGSRITFSGLIDDAMGHLAAYGNVDIALDTFPYNGATTTCEALWMGVPVISLVGDLHAARVGNTILAAVGLGSLATPSADTYVGLARTLSLDKGRLAALRGKLRGIVVNSPLCDRVRFTKGLEEAYRWMLADGSSRS